MFYNIFLWHFMRLCVMCEQQFNCQDFWLGCCGKWVGTDRNYAILIT